MDALSVACVFIGGGLGSLLRWGLGLALNPVFVHIPLGTLAANVGGGLLMGATMGVFAQFEGLPPAARLAVATGFLGGLTTFSTYSAETATLLLRHDHAWAAVHAIGHVLATLAATFAGLFATQALLKAIGGAA